MKYLAILFFMVMVSCRPDYTPKPRGYFRLDFPEKNLKTFTSDCPFTFEYPDYGYMAPVSRGYTEPCWYNLSFDKYKAKIHLTYKELNNNLAEHIEDMHTIVSSHINMADDIQQELFMAPERNVYGLIIDIPGNTASSVSFFFTDSVSHFLSGALYFQSHPNKDSLAPAIDFFRQDVVNIANTLQWK